MKILITAIAVMLLLIGCDKSSKLTANLDKKIEADQTEVDKPASELNDYIADTIKTQVSPGDAEKKKQGPPLPQAPVTDWDKKIIKNATMNIEVKDYNGYYTSFREKVKSLGGYVAQEEQSRSDYKIENTIVVKVPVDQFDNAVVLLSANAEKVHERKVTSQDVTTEFIDTKSRIEAKKLVRQRYSDLMNQAKNMQEILSVQSEINSIQEEIEAATGRINYLGHSAVFSTITLTCYQVLNSSAKQETEPSLGAKIGQAFKTGWSWIADLLVGLISIWPLFIAAFLLIIVYKRTKTNIPKQSV